jgi:hypothetical protein
MIGWTQDAVIGMVGEPSQGTATDVPDGNGHRTRKSPPGPYRTLQFRTWDGTFLAWFHQDGGRYVCFRSAWLERGTYY